MMQRASIIELHGITKKYGSQLVLRDLSLRIPPGITGLLGPNGAGKSTLIKILLGLIRFNAGHGRLLGMPLGRSHLEVLERVGYMPEDDCYIPGLSGVETVQFAAQLTRCPAKESLRRAHEMLDFCGMGQERYRPVESYSTGMRQKLKFASALVHDPELLILDEPTSGLDPDERVALLGRIQSLADGSSKSVLLCTHILPDVELVSHHVVILSRGVVKLSCPMEELRRPSLPKVEVTVLGDVQAFEQEVARARFRIETSPAGICTVEGELDDVFSQVWRWAQASRTTITRLTPMQNSLHQVFMDAVQEDVHAGV